MRDALLAAHEVCKRFGVTDVLDGVSVSLWRGEVVVVLGPSGCGKTTLLRCLVLLDVPERGEIVFDGKAIATATHPDGTRSVNGDTRVRELRKRCGVAFQGHDLWSHMTILQNVIEVPVGVHRLHKTDAVARAMPLLESLGIADLRDRYPQRLSGGEQQRASIARALVMEPEILLLDEPTSALDPVWTARIAEALRGRAGAGCGVIVVTHDIEFARAVATSVLFLDRGRVLDAGTPSTLLAPPYRASTARFLAAMTQEVRA